MEKPIRTIVFEEYEDRIEINGEAWEKKWINRSNSGHLYRGSGMETSSDCGNCDGANCDWCREEWTVGCAMLPTRPWFNTRKFEDEADAKEFYEKL